MKPLLELFLSFKAIETRHNLPPQIKKQILKRALKKGMLEIALNNNYDSKSLLNKSSIQWLKKLFSSTEIKELQDYLVSIRDNLSKTIERFPD
jgi:hypothetical protein